MALSNLKMEVVGTELIIRVLLTQEVGPSSSGKSVIIGSTNGNVTLKPSKVDMAMLAKAGVKVPENIRVGVNVFRKVEGVATA